MLMRYGGDVWSVSEVKKTVKKTVDAKDTLDLSLRVAPRYMHFRSDVYAKISSTRS